MILTYFYIKTIVLFPLVRRRRRFFFPGKGRSRIREPGCLEKKVFKTIADQRKVQPLNRKTQSMTSGWSGNTWYKSDMCLTSRAPKFVHLHMLHNKLICLQLNVFFLYKKKTIHKTAHHSTKLNPWTPWDPSIL